MKGHLLFLGSGASMGVPIIGCSCAVCTSTSPYNKRLRPSVLIQLENKNYLIDVGPDFRYQCLHAQIDHVEGILFTHCHQDHTAGMDDLRPFHFRRKTPIPFIASKITADDIRTRFHFIFKPNAEDHQISPRLEYLPLPDKEGVVYLNDFPIHYCTYSQGEMDVNGFRMGDVAYLTDIKEYAPSIFQWLQGVKTLILSCLRHTSSPLHLSVDEAVDFVRKAGVDKAWLTHISHDLDHEKTNAYLPSHIQLAYDGLNIEFSLNKDLYERR